MATGHGATRPLCGRRRRSKAGRFSTERQASEGRSGRPGYVTVITASTTKPRFFARAGILAPIFGPDLLEAIHRPDEYVPLEKLEQARAIYSLTAIAMPGRA